MDAACKQPSADLPLQFRKDFAHTEVLGAKSLASRLGQPAEPPLVEVVCDLRAFHFNGQKVASESINGSLQRFLFTLR